MEWIYNNEKNKIMNFRQSTKETPSPNDRQATSIKHSKSIFTKYYAWKTENSLAWIYKERKKSESIVKERKTGFELTGGHKCKKPSWPLPTKNKTSLIMYFLKR